MHTPTFKNGKRYNTLNLYLRKKHGEKVGKLSLNAGLTCPNRDGTLSFGGCIFCGEDGAGTFAGCPTDSIHQQIKAQKKVQSDKWKVSKYIAYFQSYTNTYGDPQKLRALYLSALEDPEVCGIAIATRPDCLNSEILEALEEINERTHLWIELGLQTIHDHTAKWLNRGYNLKVFEEALSQLKQRNIETVVHLIVGLPGESEADMIACAKYLADRQVEGVKIHLLHVIKGTELEKYYRSGALDVLDKETYINRVVKILEVLPPEMIVHRVTGDGARDTLIAPRWTLDKRAVLNEIDKHLVNENTWQSKQYKSNINK